MAKVFVSHANADQDFVDKFVDYILRIGCGLNRETVFYSSERDLGVRSGANVMQAVRDEVDAATLVIAIITPMYQSRPVCIAELGAAWGRSGSDRLFPLVAPSLNRKALKGVIPSTLAERLDDPDALDELLDRIKDAVGIDVATTQWGAGKRKWLAFLESGGIALQVPEEPTAEEYQDLRTELEEVRGALDMTEAQVTELQARLAAVMEADTDDAKREALLPKAVRERFEVLHAAAVKCLSSLPGVVREAIYQDLRGEGIAWPNAFEEPDAVSAMDDAVERRLLVETGEGIYTPNDSKRRVRDAMAAVEALQECIRPEWTGEEFAQWFEEYYDAEPDLSDRDCWEALL